jgi:hypothetical protein
MTTQSSTIIENFLELLVNLSETEDKNFSGAGFVLYDNPQILKNYHCNLVNDNKSLPFLKLGTDELLLFLTKIANYRHPYHDGFHFINSDGVLTHVAQFFSPPVNKLIPNIQGQGARTFCSQCGSKIAGVVLMGSVSSNRNIYLFENGELANEKFILANA